MKWYEDEYWTQICGITLGIIGASFVLAWIV